MDDPLEDSPLVPDWFSVQLDWMWISELEDPLLELDDPLLELDGVTEHWQAIFPELELDSIHKHTMDAVLELDDPELDDPEFVH